ncbi:MAG: DUF1838 family protein [Acidobacteriota bacterium]
MSRFALAIALVLALIGSVTAATAGQLDLSNPEDAVKAMHKLQCNWEDGKPAVYWWTGSTYSRVPGERDRKLFDYMGMNVRACKGMHDPERGPGYRMVSRELLIYLDPSSGEIMRTWENPWTGEELEVVHIANDPVNSRAPLFARGPRGPFTFDAEIKNGRGWLAFQVPLFYTNPLGGEYQEYIGGTYQAIEMFSWFFDADQLLDDQIGGMDGAFVGWSRMSKWLPWMRMGDRAGQMMYTGAGVRLGSYDELPKQFKDEIQRNYPGYDEPPPLDDQRPNETSWTYFKKHIDDQREAQGEDGGHDGH